MAEMKNEFNGKTMDDAIKNGLDALGVTWDEVDIVTVQEGSKGLFGIGGKDFIVRLTKKASAKTTATDFLHNVLERMNIQAVIEVKEDDEKLEITLSGDNMGILIGHRGETLDALQYLTNLVVNSKPDGKKIVLDTENYRQKRIEVLEKLAKRLASKVRSTGRPVTLEPMTPYERRILHATLQGHPYVTTISEGEDPNRRVVIILK